MESVRNTTSETILVETVLQTETIELSLSEEEAQFLMDIFSKIGGDPDTSRRHIAREFELTLTNLGFSWDTSDLDGSIYCIDDPRRAL